MSIVQGPWDDADIEKFCLAMANEALALQRTAESGHVRARALTGESAVSLSRRLGELLLHGHLTPGAARKTDHVSATVVRILMDVYEEFSERSTDREMFRDVRRGMITPNRVLLFLASSGGEAAYEMLVPERSWMRQRDWARPRLLAAGITEAEVAFACSLAFAVAHRRGLSCSDWSRYSLSAHDRSVVFELLSEETAGTLNEECSPTTSLRPLGRLGERRLDWFAAPSPGRTELLAELGLFDDLSPATADTAKVLALDWVGTFDDLRLAASSLSR